MGCTTRWWRGSERGEGNRKTGVSKYGVDCMSRKETIHSLLSQAASELLGFIKDSESEFRDQDYWVPAAKIKNDLDLNFVAVPMSGKQYSKRGWLFATLARMLEEKSLIEYKKQGSRAYYRPVR